VSIAAECEWEVNSIFFVTNSANIGRRLAQALGEKGFAQVAVMLRSSVHRAKPAPIHWSQNVTLAIRRSNEVSIASGGKGFIVLRTPGIRENSLLLVFIDKSGC